MRIIILLFFLSINNAQAQISAGAGLLAKEYSKDVSLFRAKAFVMKHILGETNDVIKFDVDPLVASNSGELTTLVYKCDTKSKVGLLLGFNGTRWNEAGVVYQEYSFKNLPINEANEFCEKIEIALKVNSSYLEKDHDNNNIYFNYNDLSILMYSGSFGIRLRVFWNGYDAEWDYSSFTKTVKRLKKEINRY
jgi:hypothetical protein